MATRKTLPTISKPAIDTSGALAFATESTRTTKSAPEPDKEKKIERSDGKRSFFAPEGYQRLTINLRQDLHKGLKLLAVEQETNVGKILEALIEDHLAKHSK